jgi:hypothetical protein
MQPAPLAGIFPISLVLSHGVGATSNLCVSTENTNDGWVDPAHYPYMQV